MNDEPTNDYPDWGLLGAWVAVVESESVSHAARRLGLSQAAASMRGKMLEGKLGTHLPPPPPPPAAAPRAPPPPPAPGPGPQDTHAGRGGGAQEAFAGGGGIGPAGGGPSC